MRKLITMAALALALIGVTACTSQMESTCSLTTLDAAMGRYQVTCASDFTPDEQSARDTAVSLANDFCTNEGFDGSFSEDRYYFNANQGGSNTALTQIDFTCLGSGEPLPD